MFQIRNCFASGLVAGALASTALLHVPAAKAAAERVLHSFDGGADGANPEAGLINVKGTLYGTTGGGGANGNGYGTVFKVNPTTGAETVVYSFCSRTNCADGAAPVAGLIDVGGTLYGTTANGGGSLNCGTAAGCGTVFKVNPATGAETVVYSFCSQPDCTDADMPDAGLIDVGGTLYGTTIYGGANCAGDGGCGTVFKINPTTSAEMVLHSFDGGADGANPEAGLINVKGNLYGTTEWSGSGPGGTVFKVNPTTGTETVVYSFCSRTNCADGADPKAGLIDVGGTLYGTTAYGGIPGCNGAGCGTVFKVDATTGAYRRVWSFGSGTDGGVPAAGLVNVGGTLYGTTEEGGANNGGTVFRVTLP